MEYSGPFGQPSVLGAEPNGFEMASQNLSTQLPNRKDFIIFDKVVEIGHSFGKCVRLDSTRNPFFEKISLQVRQLLLGTVPIDVYMSTVSIIDIG